MKKGFTLIELLIAIAIIAALIIPSISHALVYGKLRDLVPQNEVFIFAGLNIDHEQVLIRGGPEHSPVLRSNVLIANASHIFIIRLV